MVTLSLVGGLLFVASNQAQGANTVPFTERFSANANGAVVTIGNNSLSCAPSNNCTNAQNGGSFDNNSFIMQNQDVDSDSSTFNSSSSQLDLPAGATVLWAGLYWGARLNAGGNGQAATQFGPRTSMKFKTPGMSDYQTLTTQAEFGPNSSSSNAYQEFVDVTALVQQAGNGDYWGANVAAGTGYDRYGGWALTVAYQAPGLPLRNLSV
ncbi:MAG: hypothetical protein LBL92_07550, partial [Propionibacteriaceae bacterium]|nr:hypothetical protein [Propionibacteriaceae bacterium]